MADQLDEVVTIPAAGTTSGVVSNVGATATGVILPAVFTGIALSYLVCATRDGTFVGLNNSAGAISSTVAQNKAYLLPAELKPFPYFKLVSGTAEAAARSITVMRQIER